MPSSGAVSPTLDADVISRPSFSAHALIPLHAARLHVLAGCAGEGDRSSACAL